jgi:hypothetical protein
VPCRAADLHSANLKGKPSIGRRGGEPGSGQRSAAETVCFHADCEVAQDMTDSLPEDVRASSEPRYTRRPLCQHSVGMVLCKRLAHVR